MVKCKTPDEQISHERKMPVWLDILAFNWSYLTAVIAHSFLASQGEPCFDILPVFVFPGDSLVLRANPA
jgi:hypothetical protein